MKTAKSTEYLTKLTHSIKELEDAIDNASQNIQKNPKKSNHPILERLNEYKTIVLKQKIYVNQLSKEVENENHDEIYRLVNIINGISNIIKDDAREVLSNMHGTKPTKEEIAH